MIIALEIQFNSMREVVALLTPLEVTTKELCGEHYATANKNMPMMLCLANKIDSTKCYQKMRIQLKETLHAETKSRFRHIEEVLNGFDNFTRSQT
jgi:hypothetical protein